MDRKEAIKSIKSLIDDVIDYNENNGTHIFFDYSPHCDLVTLYYYNKDKRYGSNGISTIIKLHYDFNVFTPGEFEKRINIVRKWIR